MNKNYKKGKYRKLYMGKLGYWQADINFLSASDLFFYIYFSNSGFTRCILEFCDKYAH